MFKKMILIIGLIVFTFFLSVLFMLIGINIGGNYFTNFELLGMRGYEATGNLGFLIGVIIGVLTSIAVYLRLTKNTKGA